MPSRKYRPIVMNRNRKPVKKHSTLKTLLLLLAIATLIVFGANYVKNKKTGLTSTREETRKDSSRVVAKPVETPANLDTVTGKAGVEVASKDTSRTMKPVTTRPKVADTRKAKDTTLMRKPGLATAAKPNTLSDEKMAEILNEVKLAQQNSNTTTKCVSVKIVNSSNAENGFKIANYLRKNGYIISGREVIGGSQKGIQITTAGPCLKLTIGTM